MGKTIFYVTILFSVLFFVFPASGSEELFEEYETLLTRVTGNYEGALRAPDSRAGSRGDNTICPCGLCHTCHLLRVCTG